MDTFLKIVGIALMLTVVSCHHEETDHAEESVKFLVTTPLRTDTITTSEYVCQIHAIQHIELRALERGYLEKILVDEGQVVRKGQQMFQIMPVIYQAEFKHAEAEARVAEIEYQNTKSLADKNVVSQNELAMAKARYDQALAAQALAKAHLDFTKISAPFTGIMDRLHVRMGSLLEEGEMLASLSDNSEMWVYFNVPEAQYLNYQMSAERGKPFNVQLRLANGEIFKYDGVVTTIEADFNNETGNIAFRATFPNPDGLLRHGETGNIVMKETFKNALLIPQKATFEVLDKKFVYVVGDDGRVHARMITVGAELPHIYAVSEGIKEGDKILLEGLRKVKENDKIDYELVASKKALHGLELHAE